MTREKAIDVLEAIYFLDEEKQEALNIAIDAIKTLHIHEETWNWCKDCKEYDNENHCCHRWSNAIREAIDELGIVHCNECMYSTRNDDWTYDCKFIKGSRDGWWFCADGERK